MLWTLLVAISSLSFCSGAVHGGRFGHGLLGNVIGLAIGLPLCVANAMAWARLADLVTARIRDLPEHVQSRRLMPLYVCAGAWGLVAALTGLWLTEAALKLF